MTPEAIIASVASHYGLSFEDVVGSSRIQDVAEARHVAMYLARELSGWSYPRIGRLFERDHSTIRHACKRIGKDGRLRVIARSIVMRPEEVNAVGDVVLALLHDCKNELEGSTLATRIERVIEWLEAGEE